MTQTLSIYLSEDSPQGIWPKNSPVSFEGDRATIHLASVMRIQQIQASIRRLIGMGFGAFELAGDGWELEYQFAIAQGCYSAKFVPDIKWAGLVNNEENELNALIKTSYWCREQVNRTPEDLSPEILAQDAAEFISSFAPNNVSFTIITGEELKAKGLVGIYEVGRGSTRPPALLELDFTPDGWGDSPPAAALVGKGITFDSGGYSIKTSEGMLHMKADMGGASTVTAGLALAIARGLKQRVKLYLCCAENLISGHAYKLGDILKYKNGLSVEIVNTDAEGRLVLADGLILASESGAGLIIDAATLTGAAVTALGDNYNALFSFDSSLVERYLSYSAQENESHWRLPLEPFHASTTPSYYADLANSKPTKGGGPGGASNAAGFLSRFVSPGRHWLHIDLAAAMSSSESAYLSAGGTASGIRTIARALLEE